MRPPIFDSIPHVFLHGTEGVSQTTLSSLDEPWCSVGCWRVGLSGVSIPFAGRRLVVKLVTHSKLPMANSYSSQGRPTGPKGSLPSFKEYHESDVHQDSNMGQNALDARELGYWPLVCPFFAIPNSSVLRRLSNPRWASL
jgi:hypothetical protein